VLKAKPPAKTPLSIGGIAGTYPPLRIRDITGGSSAKCSPRPIAAAEEKEARVRNTIENFMFVVCGELESQAAYVFIYCIVEATTRIKWQKSMTRVVTQPSRDKTKFIKLSRIHQR
jgi:hypothetical protein